MNNFNSIISSMQVNSISLYVLIGCVLLLSLTIVTLLVMMRKLKREYQQVSAIKDDLKAFSVAAIGVGKRVLQLERRIRQDEVAFTKNSEPERVVTYVEPTNQSYDEAAHMARQGKNVESIMHRCGLSHSEAELIYLMNRLGQAS